MEIPKDREVFESEIATLWLDDDGILISLSKSPTRTIENIGKNVELIKQITHNKKVGVLVYLTKSKKPSKETRDFVKLKLPEIYKAMAIISNSGLGEFVMNFIFRLSKPSIPMKTFSNEIDAKNWLKQFT